MVNYCCVYGCGRNSKTSKHLYYYSLPKERYRLVQWLEAVGRVDLLEKDLKKLTHRVCSRHFSPSSIKNKHLCADAVPSLCLSSTLSEGSNELDKQQSQHSNIICNSCNKSILGFRYKCITCPDYDLCSKCEMLEAHNEHYLLRIPKPVNFTVADNLIKKWRQLFEAEDVKIVTKTDPDDECSSDDDVPITKYARNYDSGIDLTEEEKTKICDEVTRILNIKHPDKREEELAKRRQRLQKKRGLLKKKKESVDMCVGTEELEAMAPEVVFADVNDIKGNQNLDVKDEILNTLMPLGTESVQTDGAPLLRAFSAHTTQVVSSTAKAANANTGTAGTGPDVARTASKTKHANKQGTTALGKTSTGPLPSLFPHSSANTALQAISSRTAFSGLTGTVNRIEDAFSNAWQVPNTNPWVPAKRLKTQGKGKHTQQTQPPCSSASVSASKKKGNRKIRRESHLYMRRKPAVEQQVRIASFTAQAAVAGPANATSDLFSFSAWKRTRAQAGASRPNPSALPTSAAVEFQAQNKNSTQRSGWKGQAAAQRGLNETVSPRGEHKRLRLDQSKRVANKSYVQVPKTPLYVAITCDRTGHISKDVSDQVLTAIQKKIISEAWSPKQDRPGPAFNGKPLYADGVLKLWCGNDHTLTWLRETVSGLALPSSVSLVVKSQSEISQRARCGIVIPDEQGLLEDPRDIGRALCYQNPWVEIAKWVLLNAVKQKSGWFVVVGIPEDQIPTLMKAGRRLSIGLGAVYIKFQGRNGRYVDVPQCWDPATATIRKELKQQQSSQPTGEAAPLSNTPEVGEEATTAADSNAVLLSGEEPDYIQASDSDLGEGNVESGDLWGTCDGLQLEENEEGSTSNGVPFVEP